MQETVNNNLPFRLFIVGINEEDLTVLNFSTKNYGLNSHYQYNIEIVLSYILPESALTQRKACLQIAWGHDQVYIHGLIDSWQLSATNIEQTKYIYHIKFFSPLNPLTKKITTRVFVKESVIDIAKTILLENKIERNALLIKTKQQYQPLDCIMQYNETDLEFLERILNQQGLFYFFIQGKEYAKLIITDNNDYLPIFPDETLSYQSQSGADRPYETIFSFEERAQYLTKSFKLNDYNNQTPGADLKIESQIKNPIPGYGTNYIYGTNHKNLSQGEQLVNIHQHSLDWKRQTFSAETDCRGLQPGHIFTISNHSINNLNGRYKIINMEIIADQSNTSAPVQNYTAKLLLIKREVSYQPAISACKKFNHLLPAFIAGNNTNTANLDQLGNYCLDMPFGKTNNQKNGTISAITHIQSHLGQHLPLLPGTQVATSFINGDLSRPVILGVISHPTHPSTSSSRNHTLNILRTHSGNELCINDKIDKQYIRIATANAENSLLIDSSAENNIIAIESQKGKFSAYCKKMCNITSKQNLNISCEQDHYVVVKNNQRLITKEGNIEHRAANDADLFAAKSLRLQSEDKDIIFKCANNFVHNSANNFTLLVEKSDLQMQTLNSDINLISKNNLYMAAEQAALFIGQDNYGITITKENNIAINVKKISLNAAQINIYHDKARIAN